jgi:hypothetical protein
MTVANPHAKIDAENRERDRRLAKLIRRRPEVVGAAQQNLEAWHRRWGNRMPAWEEWAQLLRMLTPAQVAAFLESSTPKANRLRQSSPCLGILEEAVGDKGQDAQLLRGRDGKRG